jgi:transcription termination factor Rho
MNDIPSSAADEVPAKKRAAKKAVTKKTVAKKAAVKKAAKVQVPTLSLQAEVPVAKKATKKASQVESAAMVDANATAKKTAKKAVKKAVMAVEKVAEPTVAKKRATKKVAADEKLTPTLSVVDEPAQVAPVAPLIEKAPDIPHSSVAPAPTPFPQQRPPQHQHPKHQAQGNSQSQVNSQAQHRNQGPNDHKKNKFGKNKKNNNGFDRHQKQKGKHPGQNGAAPRVDLDYDRSQVVLEGPKIEVEGLLELTPKGSGFLRSLKKNFELAKDDAFVGATIVGKWGLRAGAVIKALTQMGPRGPQVVEILAVNEMVPEEARRLPHFEELTAVNPSKRIPFENQQNRFTTRVLDIIAPVGRGQRGLIVSPPRSGKTTLMLHIAESVMQREDDGLHLMVLLVDERPEEVTEFRRALPGVEIFASSNDEHPRNHCRVAELTIERAKRLVEAGKHVFLLMDSITRLARAYNNTGSSHGRGIGTGGVTVGALEIPRRLFAAARNTRGAGSLTILATALIQTNSRADEAIFQEFKGTGNMEIVLDRKIAENYIYPAVDIFKSGTRREELLLPEHMLHKIHLIRRGLSGHKPLEAMERLTYFLKKFPSNAQMLLEIKG